ncbi:50S ribosomal protein L19, chloroplastic [Capsicum annuum]|uniref:50S ribosomal protein L19, chloroplastic n=1 Tax=Capsicum annuum TaxID=4072 RepID=A0A2G2YVQ8_CAPAN|nr:50S ribosomal protein L19, chloroplastic [Capsicum annuum]
MWRRFSSHLSSTAPSGILARFGNASKKNEVELGNLFETRLNVSVHSKHNRNASLSSPYMAYRSCLSQYSTMIPNLPGKFNKSGATSVDMVSEDASALATPRIKFKRLDKTAKHIMQILDKEAVEEVKVQREIPDIKPGYVIQLKLEVPENRRRVSIVKGTVIARRNAGLNTTIRLRRNLAGVGVENLFHLLVNFVIGIGQKETFPLLSKELLSLKRAARCTKAPVRWSLEPEKTLESTNTS